VGKIWEDFDVTSGGMPIYIERAEVDQHQRSARIVLLDGGDMYIFTAWLDETGKRKVHLTAQPDEPAAERLRDIWAWVHAFLRDHMKGG